MGTPGSFFYFFLFFLFFPAFAALWASEGQSCFPQWRLLVSMSCSALWWWARVRAGLVRDARVCWLCVAGVAAFV